MLDWEEGKSLVSLFYSYFRNNISAFAKLITYLILAYSTYLFFSFFFFLINLTRLDRNIIIFTHEYRPFDHSGGSRRGVTGACPSKFSSINYVFYSSSSFVISECLKIGRDSMTPTKNLPNQDYGGT